MFEKRMKEISKQVGGNRKRFFVLTHKKHKREIYFSGSEESILFTKLKMNSFKKRILYFFIRAKVLQIFLKKVELSEKFGDVIFVGEKVNCLDLNKREVISFPRDKNSREIFLKSKKIQEKMFKLGFAPEVYEINEKIPFSREKMVELFKEKNPAKIFDRLLEFYNQEGIERIPIKKYCDYLKKKLMPFDKKGELHPLLDSLSGKGIGIMTSRIHGDFAKENTLIDKGKIVFTDWSPYKGIITNSLVNFFRDEDNLMNNNFFNSALKFYPEEVRRNIIIYLILSELDLVANRKRVFNMAIKQLRNYFP